MFNLLRSFNDNRKNININNDDNDNRTVGTLRNLIDTLRKEKTQ
jgi:hypothetical protein